MAVMFEFSAARDSMRVHETVPFRNPRSARDIQTLPCRPPVAPSLPARSRGHAAAARLGSGGSVWRRICLVARWQRPCSNVVGVCVRVSRKRRTAGVVARHSPSSLSPNFTTYVALRTENPSRREVRFFAPSCCPVLCWSSIGFSLLFFVAIPFTPVPPHAVARVLCPRFVDRPSHLWSSPPRCTHATRHVHAERVMAERRGCHVASRATPNRWNVSPEYVLFYLLAYYRVLLALTRACPRCPSGVCLERAFFRVKDSVAYHCEFKSVYHVRFRELGHFGGSPSPNRRNRFGFSFARNAKIGGGSERSVKSEVSRWFKWYRNISRHRREFSKPRRFEIALRINARCVNHSDGCNKL